MNNLSKYNTQPYNQEESSSPLPITEMDDGSFLKPTECYGSYSVQSDGNIWVSAWILLSNSDR